MGRVTVLVATWMGSWVAGCSDEGIDREDELGTTKGGRYELVVLEAEEEGADSLADQSPEPANAAVFFDPKGAFTVQIGVYREAAKAKKLVRELKAEGYPAYGADSPEGVRVRIGYFTQREDAERFGRIFAADRGVEYWIDRRADE